MILRDSRGRFLASKNPSTPRPWTILATDRRHSVIQVVNRRRDRLISRIEATQVRFETEEEAGDYLARLPVNSRYLFTINQI